VLIFDSAVWVVALFVARHFVARGLRQRSSQPREAGLVIGLIWAALPLLLWITGVDPGEPILIAGTALILGATAFAGTVLVAQRALGVGPSTEHAGGGPSSPKYK